MELVTLRATQVRHLTHLRGTVRNWCYGAAPAAGGVFRGTELTATSKSCGWSQVSDSPVPAWNRWRRVIWPSMAVVPVTRQ